LEVTNLDSKKNAHTSIFFEDAWRSISVKKLSEELKFRQEVSLVHHRLTLSQIHRELVETRSCATPIWISVPSIWMGFYRKELLHFLKF
jgi:hypothetical protein